MAQLPDDSDKPDTSGGTESNSLMLIAESIGTYFGKLPVALQKNVTKALGHLLCVPIAYLDGKASELKAASAARVKITDAMGKELAKSVKVDSELAEIATATHANKILRHQKNNIKILGYAFEEINSMHVESRVEPTISAEQEKDEPKEISEDWLSAFESEAVNMSSEQMQKLFGKMLAGEMSRPSTFSVRTVKLMGQMDADVAALFRKFCSMTCSYMHGKERIVVDGRVITFSENRFPLHDFGFPQSKILMLEEYGLITSSEPMYFPYDMSIFGKDYESTPTLPLIYNNTNYMLVPKAPKSPADFKTFGASGIMLSRVGRELLKVVEMEENRKYTEALISYLEKQGLALFRLPDNMQA
jgi:hypothetical protein